MSRRSDRCSGSTDETAPSCAVGRPARRDDGPAIPEFAGIAATDVGRGPRFAPQKGGPSRSALASSPRPRHRSLGALRGRLEPPARVRSTGAIPWASTCRSRMPLIGLVRLQRALRAATPCSTQCSFSSSAVTSLGDADTEPVATRKLLPGRRDGAQSVPGAARNGSNLCRAGGRRCTSGNRRGPRRRNLDGVVLEGASRRDRRIAQACNGALRGRCAEIVSQCRGCSPRRTKLEVSRRVREVFGTSAP